MEFNSLYVCTRLIDIVLYWIILNCTEHRQRQRHRANHIVVNGFLFHNLIPSRKFFIETDKIQVFETRKKFFYIKIISWILNMAFHCSDKMFQVLFFIIHTVTFILCQHNDTLKKKKRKKEWKKRKGKKVRKIPFYALSQTPCLHCVAFHVNI